MPSRTVARLGLRGALTLASGVVCVLAVSDQAQPRIIVDQVVNPADKRGSNDPQQGVYVRDSAIAADKFELGKRMERLKEWHKSADVYQEILKTYKDRVVPIKSDEKGTPRLYASVRVAVQDRLARWPEEGLVVYRNRFEPEAAALLDSAKRNDLATLHQVFDAYFASDSAKVAGMRLIDLYMESGEFSAAASLGERLLEWHPNLVVERPQALFRTALAHQLAGNKEAAEKRAKEIQTHFANEVASIAGKDTKLSDAIGPVLAEPPLALASLSGDSYPMVHSDPSRSGVPAGGGRPGALAHATRLGGPVFTGMNDQVKSTLAANFDQAAKSGNATGVIPVVDRGELFFQDGFRVYALHVESGAPLAGWAQTHGGNRNGQFILPGQAEMLRNIANPAFATIFNSPRQTTLTLTDDAVLGVMGIPDISATVVAMMGGGMVVGGGVAGNPNASSGTKLVCLARADGKLRWTADPNALPNNAGNPRNLSFSGSPLVVGDNVYVIARGGSGAGVEDCHLVCYELSSGKYQWACYIASSQMGAAMAGFGGMPRMGNSDTLSHPAFASGRVFVCTNLGAVSAVDAYTGATAWLSIYDRDEVVVQRLMMGAGVWMGGGFPGNPTNQDATKPWEFNPVIVTDGKVFALPNDGKNLIIYDAATGDEIKRIPRDIERNGNTTKLTMLLAVMGDKLILGGNGAGASVDKIFCFNWRAYTPKGDDGRKLDISNTFWIQDIDKIKGRPFVTHEHIFLPLEKALAVVNIAKGKVEYRHPKAATEWPENEGPGNVVVTKEQVIVAGPKFVNVYTDLQGVRDKYAAALHLNPNDTEAHLVYTELMFNARELDESKRVLDEAIRSLGGLNSMANGPLRTRVFIDALTFAERLSPEAITNDTTLDLTEELYDRSAAAAADAGQQVRYRLSRARFLESLNKPSSKKDDVTKAVRLYQEILSSAEMRIISVSGEDPSGGSVQAGKVAETAINEQVRKIGPSIYEAFEKAATDALAKVSEGDKPNPDQMLAVAENYPNSKVAQAALMRAADTYEKSGQPRLATQVLRRLYWKYNSRLTAPDRAKLGESMARNYLKAGNTAAALGRLQRASQQAPDAGLNGPLLMPDGTSSLKTTKGQEVKTLAEAASALQIMAQQKVEKTLPNIKLPPRPTMADRLAKKPMPKPFIPSAADETLANVMAIIEPPVELQDLSVTDRLLIWAEGKLVCLPAGAAPAKAQPIWTSNALIAQPAGLAWLGDKLVLWGEGEVALLGSAKGDPIWKIDLRQLPAVDVINTGNNDGPQAAGPEPAAVGAAVNPNDPDVLFARDLQIAQARAQALQVARAVRAADKIAVNAGGGPIGPGGPQAGAAAAQADGKERVLHVRPLADRFIVSTSTGRVIALAMGDGHTIWQTRLSSSQPFEQTLASDDFVVVRAINGSFVQLTVLDTFNGQQLLRRAAQTNQGNWPINCALGDDGTLVWTTPSSIVGKDLYEPGDTPTWERPGSAGGYAGLTRPDQLVIAGQHILAVCSQGRFVERRSVSTGDTLGEPLATGTSDLGTRLRLTGPRLYIVGTNRSKESNPPILEPALVAYHLENQTTYAGRSLAGIVALPNEVVIAQDHVLVPGLVAPKTGDKQSTTYTLQCLSREMIVNNDTGKPTESGLLAYSFEFEEPAKIRSWHALDGGVYYLSEDNRLHLLKANGPSAP